MKILYAVVVFTQMFLQLEQWSDESTEMVAISQAQNQISKIPPKTKKKGKRH